MPPMYALFVTNSGSPLPLINPHTSFYFRGEVHVVSEEGLNVYGAVTWGQFFVYQGFNEHTGWMHTSTYVDFIDEFVEEIVEREGRLFYRYGDRLRPVSVSAVTLKFRDGEDLSERSFTMYRTHHGPITHELDGRWVATRINWDPENFRAVYAARLLRDIAWGEVNRYQRLDGEIAPHFDDELPSLAVGMASGLPVM